MIVARSQPWGELVVVAWGQSDVRRSAPDVIERQDSACLHTALIKDDIQAVFEDMVSVKRPSWAILHDRGLIASD